jgi:hypothetical protein
MKIGLSNLLLKKMDGIFLILLLSHSMLQPVHKLSIRMAPKYVVSNVP